jgi:hypothetical protein
VEDFKALLDWINGKLSAPLARSVAGSVLALSCVGTLIHTLNGYDWRYVLLSAWFLGCATLALLGCVFAAWKNRWILNKASKLIVVVMIILVVIGSRMTWNSAQFGYNPLGIFEQRRWHSVDAGNTNRRWTWRLRAASETPLKFQVRIDSNCDGVHIVQFYPVADGDVSPSWSEVGFQLPESRMWEIDAFRRPAEVEFYLVLNDDHADANRCIAHELRM